MCHCPSTVAPAPTEKGGATSFLERPAAATSLAPWKFTRENAWQRYMGKVSRQVCFFKKQIIHQAHSLFAETINKNSGLNFHRSVFVFMCMSMSVCVCPRV